MYALIARKGLSSCVVAHSFPWKRIELVAVTAIRGQGLRNVIKQQQKWFSFSRIRYSKEGKIITNVSKPKPKNVPKLSELRKLMQVAHPERWKIAGKAMLIYTCNNDLHFVTNILTEMFPSVDHTMFMT